MSEPILGRGRSQGTETLAGGLAPAAPSSAWFWEATTCGAGNRVSFATGSSECHEALQWRSGRWVLFSWSRGAEEEAAYRQVAQDEARAWLLRNEHFDAAASVAVPGHLPASGRSLVRRVYAPRAAEEGIRVLVDRLWPRGLRRDSGLFDSWAKAAAPSTPLRLWYGHRQERLPEFRRRYEGELQIPPACSALGALTGLMRRGPLTLVTATRELASSAAEILADQVAIAAGSPGKLRSAPGARTSQPTLEDLA
ncbi:MAG: DUF488 family protein [Candidatus Dormibacteraeota bacterium]|nr:DUF488 family protein [Candidatus Dormibacteraeota bacterium]